MTKPGTKDTRAKWRTRIELESPIPRQRDITKVLASYIVAPWCYASHSIVAFSRFTEFPIVVVSSSGGGLFGRPAIHNESGALLIFGRSFVPDFQADFSDLSSAPVTSTDSIFPDCRLR
jgi:hypothetical protein